MAVRHLAAQHPTHANISPMAAAVFAQMLERPLKRRISAATGIDPRNADELREMYAELDRVGSEWLRSRPPISVAAGSVTEMHSASSLDMKIDTIKAAELLRLTDSRVRQLLRDGSLPGRKVGRRWVVKRSDVLAYRVPAGKAAA
jgi:excisionase family DNA binding protein